jgi:hypothetical protein
VVYLQDISSRRGTQAHVAGATNVLTARSQHDTATEGARGLWRRQHSGNGEGVGPSQAVHDCHCCLRSKQLLDHGRTAMAWGPARGATCCPDRWAGEASRGRGTSADLALRRMPFLPKQAFCARPNELGAAIITRTQWHACSPNRPITARLPRCIDRSLFNRTVYILPRRRDPTMVSAAVIQPTTRPVP